MAFRVLLPHTEGTFTFYSIKDFIAEFLFFSLGPAAGSGILLTDNLICETHGFKTNSLQLAEIYTNEKPWPFLKPNQVILVPLF